MQKNKKGCKELKNDANILKIKSLKISIFKFKAATAQ
jgi:hypothetical protein